MVFEVDDRLHRDARRGHVDQQEGDALLLLRGLVGAHQQEAPVGVHRQRGPGLLAIDDVGVAIQHGFGAQRSQVRPRVRFGIALAPDVLAAQDLRQEFLLLFGRAVVDQQRADHDDAVVVGARAAVALDLLGEDDLLGGRQAQAAELPRPARTQPALLGQLEVPGLVLIPMQALGRVEQLGRVVRHDPAADMRAEGVVVQQVQVRRFVRGDRDHRFSLRRSWACASQGTPRGLPGSRAW